jgi:DNA repair exonuclease SbcCD ATPase subunit
MRFRHQVIVPKQDLPVYARDRLEKAEDENARLRQQMARLQRQHQDQETFYEKRMAEEKIEWERAEDRKLAEQQRAISKRYEEQKTELQMAQQHKLAERQRAAALKQHEEQIRSQRAREEEEVKAVLRKEIQELNKKIAQFDSPKKKTYESGKRLPEIEGQTENTKEVGELTSELEKARQDLRRERHRATGSSPLPPLPHPLYPLSSLREIRRWLFRRDKLD